MKKCLMKLNGRCQSMKHHGKICGALNEIICPEKRKIQRSFAERRKMARADEPLGIGA